MARRILIITALVLAVAAGNALPQEVYFGKNKVRYHDFDWQYIQTRHFDIYFYEDAYPVAKFAAQVLESAYKEISDELNYMLQDRVPVFIYNSHNDFQQTNIIPNLLPEGVGGFTEAFKNRIAIPFVGSYEDFRHVLHHELTHAMIYNMLFGNSFASVISRRRLFELPDWFSEGYAEYSSRHGWDYASDMWMRDATVNDFLIPPQYLYGYPAYRQGQAMVKYIVDKYGEAKLHEILQKGKIHLTMAKTIKAALGVEEKDFWKEFEKEMKRRYWPSLRERKEADEIGKPLTKAREDGSYYNEKPAWSPDGDKIAIFTDKSDYTEIVLISPYDGKRIKRLVKAQRSGDLESLHSYVSGMSFSPDGRSLVFVAKSGGKEAIFFVDVESGDIYRKVRLDFKNIQSPAWSPDGKLVAFSALKGPQRDLYLYKIDSQEIVALTDDRYDDVEASWTPDSRSLVFSSDHPHPRNPVIDHGGHPYVTAAEAYHPGDFDYGTYNLFRIDIDSRRIDPVDVGPGQNRVPRVSPDGSKVAFVSNRSGIDNLYVGFLDSVRYYAVTDILTGVRDHSWSPDGEKLAFSAFFQAAYDIFVLKELVPVGTDGVVAATDYALGKYDLLQPPAVEEMAAGGAADSTAAVSPTDTIPPVPTDSTLVPVADTVPLVPTDSTLVPVADSAQTAPTDSLADTAGSAAVPEAPSPDSTGAVAGGEDSGTPTIDTTGVYDDEFVYVGSSDSSALADVLTEITRDSLAGTKPLPEPAEFDSIPVPAPGGEYKVHKYRVRFTPDFVGGGFSYDTFWGLRGQTYFVFSDYLGNHQIYIATDLVNTIDQSYLQAYYFNRKNRVNLGVGVFHTKNFYEDNNGFLFSDRFYGAQGFASHPFSMFSRVEASVGQFFVDRKYYDRFYGDTREDRSSKITTAYGAWVFDNVLWGYTGPVNGRRYKFSLDGGINLFDSDDINFYSFGVDLRRYWHFMRTFSMAFRVSGGASFGQTPKQYFLGGTTNWIGSRTLDASVYDVENLYFSNVVTPLRGQDYYGLSGTRYGLVNWEFRFPMVRAIAMRYPLPLVLTNITGVVFTDIGAAWFDDDFKGAHTVDGHSRLNDVKVGFGLGARIYLLNFLLLRYDLGWATDGYKVSDHPTSYFSFGADF